PRQSKFHRISSLLSAACDYLYVVISGSGDAHMRSFALAFARSIADTAGSDGGAAIGVVPSREFTSDRAAERVSRNEGNGGNFILARRSSAAENHSSLRPAISSKWSRSKKRTRKNTRSLTWRVRKPVALNASFHPVRSMPPVTRAVSARVF